MIERIPLDYVNSRPWYRRRSTARIVLLLAVAAISSIGGQAGWRRFQVYRHDRQVRLDEALVVASFNGDPPEVSRLLRAGANVNCRYGKEGDVVFRGKDGGYPMAASKWTPLIAATSNSDLGDPIAVVRLLIEASADLNLNDGYGATPLYEPTYFHREASVHFLLDHGAKVNTHTGVYIDGPDGESPLHRALGSPAILRALLAKGADPNTATTDGSTPLYEVARSHDEAAVRLLIDAGANPNITTKDGETPLMTVEWSAESIEILNRRFSGTQRPSTLERRAVEAADLNHDREPEEKRIADMLRNAGATR